MTWMVLFYPIILHHLLLCIPLQTIFHHTRTGQHLSLQILFIDTIRCPPTRSTISCRYGPPRCLKSNHHHMLMSMIYTKQLMLLPSGRSHGSASQFHIMDQIRMMHHGRLQHMTSGSEILGLSFTASLLTRTLRMRWTLHQNRSKIIMGNTAIRILCQETGPGDKRYVIPISNSSHLLKS